VASIQTVRAIEDLEFFYKVTGDRRYLDPIPAALDWLERSRINDDSSKTYFHPYFGKPRPYTHAYYYELGTNKPIYAQRSGSGVHDEKFWLSYDFENMYPYGPPYVLRLEPIRAEYDRISALSPDEARAEYEKESISPTRRKTDPAEVRLVIDSLDSRGAWVTDAMIPQYLNDALGSPPIPKKVIDVRLYTRNMETLIGYVKAHDEK